MFIIHNVRHTYDYNIVKTILWFCPRPSLKPPLRILRNFLQAIMEDELQLPIHLAFISGSHYKPLTIHTDGKTLRIFWLYDCVTYFSRIFDLKNIYIPH